MWQDLVNVLETLVKHYQELLALAHKKTAVLVAVDMKGLEKLVQQEEKIIAAIHAAEECRKKALQVLSQKEMGIRTDMHMEELVAMSPGLQRESLRKLHQELNEVIQKVKAESENNSLLVNSALSAVKYHLNRIGGTQVQPTYGRQGGELISKEKKFDFQA